MDDKVHYTCHPIQTMLIGDYVFEKSTLVLTPEQAADFDELLDKLPPFERIKIAKISVQAAEDLIARMTAPAASQSNDSGTLKAALLKLQGEVPSVGTQPIDQQA